MFSLNLKSVGLFLGPVLFAGIRLFFRLEGLDDQGISVLAVTAWVALWWITEVVEVEVTALLPIVLFPLTGGLGLVETCAAYGHKYIFLFVGGFILAIAIQKWDLHKRIALNIIRIVGTNPKRIILGFMLSTAFLSMWISNTATAVMMLPIGLAVAGRFDAAGKGQHKFATALLLSIAYAASIGGMATLIGTPPNLILAGVFQESLHMELSFINWMYLAFPFSMVLLFLCWAYLVRIVLRNRTFEVDEGAQTIRERLKQLGPMSFEEKVVLAVFVVTATLWITRSLFLNRFIPAIDDTMIAISAAIVLFLLPSSYGRQKLLTWSDAVKLPWGILILFGGGISIAVAFQESGLAPWIAGNLGSLRDVPLVVVLLILVAAVNFLTEITSNLATASVLLPVLVSLAVALDVHPFVLMVGATMAASCAFMLPVATPPNAIVFGSDYVKLTDMMKAGFRMNLISIVLICLVVYYVLPLVWGINIHEHPGLMNGFRW